MIYKNNKIIMNSSDGLLDIMFNGSLTGGNRKNLIANMNELDEALGVVDGKSLIVFIADELKTILEGKKRGNSLFASLEKHSIGIIDDVISRFDNNIKEYVKNYELEPDELRNLNEDDYRHAYNQGDKTYEASEYKGLLLLKIHSVLYMFIILMYTTDTHPNKINSIFESNNIVKFGEPYSRLKRFIVGHTDAKPSIIIEIGELMNVIPLVDNVTDIMAVQACMKLAYSQSKKLISAVYSVIRLSRNPQVAIFSKSSASGDNEELSWVTSFRQTSEVSLGQVGEIQEYFNDINELCMHYGIKDDERYLLKESDDMCKELIVEAKYGTYINIPQHIDIFLNPVTSSIIQPSYIKYLEVPQIINVIGIAYVLAMRVSKPFAYLIHCVDMDRDMSELSHLQDNKIEGEDVAMEGMAINIPSTVLEEVTNELFYDNDTSVLKGIISSGYSTLAKAIGVSIRSGEVIDCYTKMKPDYLAYLRMTLSL